MKQQGQIAIITLFSLAVFVVIGGSIATQVIFEQKKAVLEEKSRQAYYAAESGVEKALQEIMANTGVNPSLTVNDAKVTISADDSSDENTTQSTILSSGGSYFFNLLDYEADSIKLCWDTADTGIVAIYFYEVTGILRTNTYVYNSIGSSNINNAISSLSGNNLCGLTGTTYYDDLSLPTGEPKYMAVWVAYENNVTVGLQALEGANLPSQKTVITSTAQVLENQDQVTRELKYEISKVGNDSYFYPPAWLTVPVFAAGGVTYADK